MKTCAVYFTFGWMLLQNAQLLAQSQHPQRIHPTPYGYVQSVLSTGPLVFIAGQTPEDASGKIAAASDFAAQAHQAFLNLRQELEAAGSDPSRIVKLTIYVVGLDGNRLAIVRAERSKLVSTELPAATTIGIAALYRPESQIEVEAVAQLSK